MISSVKWEDLPSYELGFEKGLEAGLEKALEKDMEKSAKNLLLRQIRRRFNEETAFKSQSIIMAINSLDTLVNIVDWVIDCNNGEELLAKLDTL